MRLKFTWESDTVAALNIEASPDELAKYKKMVLQKLSSQVKIAGFRAGHVPLEVVEKNINSGTLQTEFLDEALSGLYTAAAKSEKLRPVEPPKVNVTKFVPFTTLQFDLTVSVIGEIKLPDYKKIKVPKPEAKINAKDIDNVLDNLRTRAAEHKDVDRAAKDGDQVVIDFIGKDAKGVPFPGGDAKDYSLVLGSGSFIPGFEPALVGLKAGAEKTFPVTFPKDYQSKELKGKKVTFTVKVSKVQEVVKPALDDKFAAQMGPFKTVAELKEAARQQLNTERQEALRRDYEATVVQAISNKTKVAVPKVLIDEQVERIEAEEKQNLIYQGQTWEEHLKAEGVSAEQHKEQKRPAAEERVKAGLVLSEIADKEKLDVSPEELDAKIAELKRQYNDPAMQAELDKTENRRDIAARILSEKTIALLTN